MRILAMMLKTIEAEGTIRNIDLAMRTPISISYFEKLKPYLIDLYAHKITYDKSSKTFNFNSPEPDPEAARKAAGIKKLLTGEAQKEKEKASPPPRMAACDISTFEDVQIQKEKELENKNV